MKFGTHKHFWTAAFAFGLATLSVNGEKVREITEEDRDFWSFRDIKDVPIPRTDIEYPLSNPIDAFIHAKLKENGIRENHMAILLLKIISMETKKKLI